MPIEKDLKSVVAFVKKNEKLVDDLKDTAGATQQTIERLAKRFDANRKEIETLVESLGRTRFVVGRDAGTREQQAILLDEISVISKSIDEFRDDPLLKAHFLNLRGRTFTALSLTYDDMAAKMIDFTEDEVEELHVLLGRAALDTEKRQRLAFIVDATIQLSKIALRVATKVVAI